MHQHINLFLAHAIALESSAAERYDYLAEEMASAGNGEVAAFFSKMAEFSRLHLHHARERSGFHFVVPLEQYEWGEGESPEAATWAGVDGFIDLRTAYEMALDCENRSLAYYSRIAATTDNPRVKQMAEEFAAEEAEHAQILEGRMARLRADN